MFHVGVAVIPITVNVVPESHKTAWTRAWNASAPQANLAISFQRLMIGPVIQRNDRAVLAAADLPAFLCRTRRNEKPCKYSWIELPMRGSKTSNHTGNLAGSGKKLPTQSTARCA